MHTILMHCRLRYFTQSRPSTTARRIYFMNAASNCYKATSQASHDRQLTALRAMGREFSHIDTLLVGKFYINKP